MDTQPQLFKPDRESPDVRKLLLILKSQGDWLTRKAISERTGWSDREIRMLAEAAVDERGGVIVSWQKGLCHRDHVTCEDMTSAGDQFISQGKHMIKRGIGMKRLAHDKLARRSALNGASAS